MAAPPRPIRFDHGRRRLQTPGRRARARLRERRHAPRPGDRLDRRALHRAARRAGAGRARRRRGTDLTVDGADEIAPDLSLIKGGGGALVCEKIVAAASARMVVIADHTKWVALLGHFPLPVEVVPFGLAATRRAVEAAAAAADAPGPAQLRRRPDGHPFVTDSGHFILDAALQRIPRPEVLAAKLAAIPGVVEHGLFIGLARAAVIAGPDGVDAVERPG